LSNPLGVLRTELLLELDANVLRERRAVAGGRNRDLKIAAIHNGGIVKIAVVRIVDRID
jgi:hypothetical protein